MQQERVETTERQTATLDVTALLPNHVDARNPANVQRVLNEHLNDAPVEIDDVGDAASGFEGVVYDGERAEVVRSADWNDVCVGGVSVDAATWDDVTLQLAWEELAAKSVRLSDLREGNVVGVQLERERGSETRTYAYRVTKAKIEDSGYKEVKLDPCHDGSNPLIVANWGGHGTDIYYDEREMDIPVFEREDDPDPLARNYSLFLVPDRLLLDAIDADLSVELPGEK